MHSYQHEVRYYECDRMGITHHSNYVRIMEEARVDYLDQLGFGFDKIEEEGVVSPVISIECNYKHPTTFKDDIEVLVAVEELTKLKISLVYTMSVNGMVVCTARSKHCFLEKGRPVSLQTKFPELYESISLSMAG